MCLLIVCFLSGLAYGVMVACFAGYGAEEKSVEVIFFYELSDGFNPCGYFLFGCVVSSCHCLEVIEELGIIVVDGLYR